MGATVLKVARPTPKPGPNRNPSPIPNPNPSPNPICKVPGETLLSAVAECIAAEQRVPPSY